MKFSRHRIALVLLSFFLLFFWLDHDRYDAGSAKQTSVNKIDPDISLMTVGSDNPRGGEIPREVKADETTETTRMGVAEDRTDPMPSTVSASISGNDGDEQGPARPSVRTIDVHRESAESQRNADTFVIGGAKANAKSDESTGRTTDASTRNLFATFRLEKTYDIVKAAYPDFDTTEQKLIFDRESRTYQAHPTSWGLASLPSHGTDPMYVSTCSSDLVKIMLTMKDQLESTILIPNELSLCYDSLTFALKIRHTNPGLSDSLLFRILRGSCEEIGALAAYYLAYFCLLDGDLQDMGLIYLRTAINLTPDGRIRLTWTMHMQALVDNTIVLSRL